MIMSSRNIEGYQSKCLPTMYESLRSTPALRDHLTSSCLCAFPQSPPSSFCPVDLDVTCTGVCSHHHLSRHCRDTGCWMFGIFSEMARILGANEHKSHIDMVVQYPCNAHAWEAQGQESQVYNETQSQKSNKHSVIMRQSLKSNARYTAGIMGTQGGDTQLTRAGRLEGYLGQRISINKDTERRNGQVFVKNCK